jgi:murein DD-endopeptidase MepM/ murein hydrolase activator NlpD
VTPRRSVSLAAIVIGLALPSGAAAYGWPVKPFYKQHPIRASFGDPRYHLGAESELSAFHFGVDIVAADGTPVYSVEPGVVVRRHESSVTIGRRSGRRFGYWHVRPVVRSGTHVRLHQLIGYVMKGWGHVHFAESIDGAYRNPLRKRALSPYNDHVAPTVASVQLFSADGTPANSAHIAGPISITADVYDVPPILPPAPWDVARLAPSNVAWELIDSAGVVVESTIAANFDFALPPNALYSWIYAAGSYQNKPHRPGRYVYWLAHGLDTTAFPDGAYTLEVLASDTRHNLGTATVALDIANSAVATQQSGGSRGTG